MVPNQGRKLRALLFLGVFALLGSGCGKELVDKIPTISEKGQRTVLSADGAFSMKIPSSWRSEKNLNDVAVLQAANRTKEAYIVLIADPKKPFNGIALDKFADEQVRKFLESVTDAKTKGPDKVVVDGKDALQYEISGKAEDVDVVYLYTFIESPDRFLKAVTWSLADDFESNRGALEKVTNSIRQVKPLDAASPAPSASPGESPQPEASPAGSPSPAPTVSPTPSVPVEDPSLVR